MSTPSVWPQWLKGPLGWLPGLAEMHWRWSHRRQPPGADVHPYLRAVRTYLDRWSPWAASQQRVHGPGKHIVFFATLPYWVAHVAVVGLALAARGHRVRIGYLPYRTWDHAEPRWTLRKRQLAWAHILKAATPPLDIEALYSLRPARLPKDWHVWLDELALRDAQYTLQREDIDPSSPVLSWRRQAQYRAAGRLLRWFQQTAPDLLVVPNATVLEFATAYEVARRLNIPVVSYEFEYVRGRVWVAQNEPVMTLNTDALWRLVAERALTSTQEQRLDAWRLARRGLRQAPEHMHHWQKNAPVGVEQIRRQLGLDERPVVLLATNVFGDSMTLNRQIFSHGMKDWLVRTLYYFAQRPQVQLIVRIHPGERLLAPGGLSMQEVVSTTLPHRPSHIHVIPAEADVNSYDLLELARLGIVYTTTLGLEMAMEGIPVIVCGRVHYRGRGFTWDPTTWDEYFALLEQALDPNTPLVLSPRQRERARRYAYHFFFTFPRPFPWHLRTLPDDLTQYPLDGVWEDPAFASTLEGITHLPLPWSTWLAHPS